MTLDYQNEHETEFPPNHPIVESRGNCTLQENANKQMQNSRPSQDKYRGGIISKQYNSKGLRKIHKLERKQFTVKAPVQMHTKNSRIPIRLADSDYVALIDTGSDISTIPEKILLQNENLTRLPRFTSDISAATTAAEHQSVFFKYTVFQKVTIGNYTVTNKFYVAQNSDNDIILGIPFLRQTKAHLDFGSQLCTLTLNNAIITETSTEIPPNSTVKVLCSPRTSQMNKGPVLISSCLRNKFQYKLFIPDVYTEIETLNKPVFKIPIANKTDKHIILPANLQLGFIIFLESQQVNSISANARENIPQRPGNKTPSTDLIKAVRLLSSTSHKSPQGSFPLLEHSLSSASTLTPQEKQKLLELLKEFDDVSYTLARSYLAKYSSAALGDSKRYPSLALPFPQIKQYKNGNSGRMC